MMWEYSGTITCNHWLRKKYWLQKISEQHKPFGLHAATTLCCNEISQHLLIGKSPHKGLSNVFTTRYWRNTCSCHTLITDNKMKGVIYHCTCILNHTWASPPTPPPHPIGKFGNHDKYLSDNFPIGKFDIVLNGNCPMGWVGAAVWGKLDQVEIVQESCLGTMLNNLKQTGENISCINTTALTNIGLSEFMMFHSKIA